MIWWIVIAAGALALIFFSNKGANAVWGTATLGIAVGIVLHFLYPGDFWWTIAKTVAVAALCGAFFELLPKLLSKG